MSRRVHTRTFYDIERLRLKIVRSTCLIIRIYNKFQGMNFIEKPVNEKISLNITSRNGIMDIFVVVI